MITVTALNRVRCSLAPQAIASVEAGATSTTVRLKNGASFDVLESVNEVLGLMGSDAQAPRPPKRAASPPHRRPLRAPSSGVRQGADRHGQVR